jgi:hypothetical protein
MMLNAVQCIRELKAVVGYLCILDSRNSMNRVEYDYLPEQGNCSTTRAWACCRMYAKCVVAGAVAKHALIPCCIQATKGTSGD